MPKVYALVQFTIDDPEVFGEYAKAAGPILAAHGGRLLVAGPNGDVREGRPSAGFTTIAEFPSREAAEAWYASPEYESASLLRHQATSGGSMVFADEFVPPSAPGAAL